MIHSFGCALGVAVSLVAGLAVSPAAAGPATAAALPTGVRASVVVPAFCGSICPSSVNAPILFQGASQGARAGQAVVKAGGYYRTYGAGGLSAETAGGLGALGLSALGFGAFKWWHRDQGQPLPEPTPGAHVWPLNASARAVFYETYGSPVGVVKVPMIGEASTAAVQGMVDTFSVTVTVEQVNKPDGLFTAWRTITLEYRCLGSSTWTAATGSVSPNIDSGGPKSYTMAAKCGSGLDLLRLRFPGVATQYPAEGGVVVYEYQAIPLPDGLTRRWVEQTVTCEDANGGLFTDTVRSETVIGEPGTGYDVPPYTCPPGTRFNRLTGTLKTEFGPDLDLGAASMPSGFMDAMTGANSDAPCYYSPDGCRLQLERVTGGQPGEEVTPDWKKNPSQWRCTYGGATIPIEYCTPYEVPDETGTVPVPVEDPARPGEPAPDPVLRPVVDPTPTPTPTPTPDPTVQPSPGPSGSASPTPDPGGGGGSEPPPDEPCPSIGGLTLKGILSGAVVFQAVRCALVAVFVPSEASVNAFVARVRSAWDASGPGRTVGSVSALLADMEPRAGGSGCPEFAFPVAGRQERLDFCAHGIGGLSGTVRGFTGVLFAFLGVAAALVLVLGAFGIRSPFGGGGGESS